jgi:Uma2 family endonuclease
MITARTSHEPQVSDDRGVRPVCVRLTEPFEEIVANNPEWKMERTSDGEIVFRSPTGGESGIRNSEIGFQLTAWARETGGFAFDSSTLFRLANGALRSPDASWIAADRWQQLSVDDRESYPPITPDFVIELRSKSDRLIDLQDKMKEYCDCHVRLGWLIDPLQKQVHVYKPDESSVILNDPKCVSAENILPGFVLDLSRIFS